MSGYDHQDDDRPHHAVIKVERGEKIQCWGYKASTAKTLLVYLAGIMTCGLLFLVVFYWKPDWGLRLTHYSCPLEIADSLVVKDIHERMHRVPVKKQPVKIDDESHADSSIGVSLSTIHAITRRELQIAHDGMRYFRFQKMKYVWDCNLQEFFALRGLAHDVPCSEFYRSYANGIGITGAGERREMYGLNEISVRVRPILVLLLKEVMNPFYFFQLFTVIFWFYIDYIIYTVCVVVMSAVSISISLYTTRTESTRLREMAKALETVEVLRPGDKRESVPSVELVPGDVVIIPTTGCRLTCDVVLIAGNCIVNESMLTGESVPVTKTPLPNPVGAPMVYSVDDHKRHTLFCGTEVIQVRTHGDEIVRGVVTQTGFATAKGQLVKSILYPKPTEIKLYRDALLFVGILALLALLGFIYTATIMTLQKATVGKTIIHALDIITIAVPPALPAALTIGMVYAQFRLKKHGIYCISPQRINLCGTIDVVCFDKTGTLTEDGLDLLGIRQVSQRSFKQIAQTAKLIPPSPVQAAMATCHELMDVNGEITGDPLDIKMFESTNWSLDVGQKVDSTISGSLALGRHGEKSQADDPSAAFTEVATLKIFPFASALQSMSVIAVDVKTRKTLAFVKGSPEKIISISRQDTVPPDFQEVMDGYTKEGLRLLALSWKEIDLDWNDGTNLATIQRDAVECNTEFLGLLIMQNKLKSATTPAIAELTEANIRTVMVTGDNIFTAISVGRECSMIPPGSTVLRIDAKPPNLDKPRITMTALDDDIKKAYDADMWEKSGFSETERIIVSEEEIQLLALDGTSFGTIREHYPHLMPKIAAQSVVFARMSPDQKSHLVESLQSLKLSVAMCGDGANDCGALKQAHVGIALSQAEASVAAPFTSKTATISCIPTVIKEGRCAMVTSFGLFKYMALYSLVMFSSVTVLTSVKYYIGDMQFFIFDIVLCTFFVLTVGGNKAYHQISPTRPHTKLVTPSIVFSLITQTLLQLAVQIITLVVVRSQSWYEPFPIHQDIRNVVSYENTSVFLVSNFLYLSFAFIYTPGPPYSNRFFRNIPLVIVFTLDFLILLGMLFIPPPKIITTFEMTDLPSYTFKLLLLFIAFIHFILACCVENLLATWGKLMNFMTCRLCRPKPPPKYQGVELRLLNKSFMELMSDNDAI